MNVLIITVCFEINVISIGRVTRVTSFFGIAQTITANFRSVQRTHQNLNILLSLQPQVLYFYWSLTYLVPILPFPSNLTPLQF